MTSTNQQQLASTTQRRSLSTGTTTVTNNKKRKHEELFFIMIVIFKSILSAIGLGSALILSVMTLQTQAAPASALTPALVPAVDTILLDAEGLTPSDQTMLPISGRDQPARRAVMCPSLTRLVTLT
ncbi:MAG: hypothetical protein J3R72DRAFT_494098 [Linnemannia gamsii]|nr:MAG: hypothetical protein J3R72DRAFT_494098 [Linnemannia gamsii]